MFLVLFEEIFYGDIKSIAKISITSLQKIASRIEKIYLNYKQDENHIKGKTPTF